MAVTAYETWFSDSEDKTEHSGGVRGTGVYPVAVFLSSQPQPPCVFLMRFVSRNFYIVSHLALLMMTVMKGDGAAVAQFHIPSLK